ncbi:hypothetical protein GCM10010924_48720 [Rhizobium wenxiniae]|uniref:Uncharacterized protein n=1 Tax=Rhizobium wenxiniae TaxID=1737357 RepID=A0A7X0D377_9HYPH|nr:hypothetical protein [Rhizobium wenxiniae]GGG13841.1 hypothetical protein GCM10010924_48720 [Rhizobium wenxiniae]
MVDDECDPTDAAERCCKLIKAYLRRDADVEWTEVEKALDIALTAFGLPRANANEAILAP